MLGTFKVGDISKLSLGGIFLWGNSWVFIWVFPKMVGFPTKNDHFGVLIGDTTILGNPHIVLGIMTLQGGPQIHQWKNLLHFFRGEKNILSGTWYIFGH